MYKTRVVGLLEVKKAIPQELQNIFHLLLQIRKACNLLRVTFPVQLIHRTREQHSCHTPHQYLVPNRDPDDLTR